MSVYKMFERWRQFPQKHNSKKRRDVLRFKRQALNEISRQSIDKIEDWMDTQGPNAYTFNHMFGGTGRHVPGADPGDKVNQGDWRRSFPVATKDQRVAVEMMATLRRLDWEPAFEESGESYDSKQKKTVTRYNIYVKKEREYIIPKGPRAGEKTTKKEKKRIAQAIKQEHRDGNIDEKNSQRYLRLVTQKLEYYTMNPEELITIPRLSVVVSRHPVDVLRMSDWSHISSCHSEGDTEFKCAVHEAKAQGLVAFVIATDDLEGVDLQAHEVFEDKQRSIRGIEPAGRVRLRRYENWRGGKEDETYELAIPEQRVYGSLPPGFLDTLRDWTLDVQIEYLEKHDPDFKFSKDLFGNVEIEEYPDMDDFTRTGGSYRDTAAADTWNSFFDTDKYYGDTEEDYEGEEDEEQESIEDQWAEQCENIQDVANGRSDWAGVSYYLEEGGEWGANPYLSFDAGASIKFDASEWLKPFPQTWSGEGGQSAHLQEIKELLEEVLDDPAVGEVEVRAWDQPVDLDYVLNPGARKKQLEIPGAESPTGTTRRATVEFSIRTGDTAEYYGDYGQGVTPDDFDRFTDDVENNWDGAKELVEETLRNYLAQEGFLEPTEYDKLTRKVREDDLEFKHFATDLDGSTLLISTKFPQSHHGAINKHIKFTEIIFPGAWDMPWFKAVMLATGEPATPSTPSGGGFNLAYSEWFRKRLWTELSKESKEARRLMMQQIEFPFSKEDPEEPGQYEIPGTPPREIKEVPAWASALVYTGVFWPHKDQWNTQSSSELPHDVWMWINFVLDRSMAETGELHKALDFIHYLDDNMKIVQRAARNIFTEIWPNFHEARKEELEAQETRRTRRVHYIKTLLDNAKSVGIEDIANGFRRGATHPQTHERGIPDFLPDPTDKTDPDYKVAAGNLENIQDKVKAAEVALQTRIASAGIVQTGLHAGQPATWEDAPYDKLSSNWFAGYLVDLKRALRRVHLRDLIPRDPEEIQGTMGDPVPAKRDTYEEQIFKTLREIKELSIDEAI